MRTTALITLLSGAVAAAPLAAQSVGDIDLYHALLSTPAAGLPPLATSTITGDVQTSPQLALRYGYVSSGVGLQQLNNFGATAILPLGLGTTVSLTGGASTATNSPTTAMFGIGGDTRITEFPFSRAATASRLRLGVNGEVDYGKSSHGHVVSAIVGLPISLIQGGLARDALRLVPFVTPAYGFADNSFKNLPAVSGSRFVIGTGVGIYNRTSTVAVDFGLQFVAIPNAQAEIGVGVVLGGR